MGLFKKLFRREKTIDYSEYKPEDDCFGLEPVVRMRIQEIIAEHWSDCELREDVPAGDIGAGYLQWTYTYGVYRNGAPVAMINLLTYPDAYKDKYVLQSKQACQDMGIGYVHFLLRMPNRSSYILERFKEIIPTV